MTSKQEEVEAQPPAYTDMYKGQQGPGYPQQAYPQQGYPQQPYPQQYAVQPYPAAQPYPGQIPQTGVQQPGVVTQQPLLVTQVISPPPDHLGYSIFVTVCCCWLIGIFAILKSSECRDAVARGDQNLANQKSAEAKRLANTALGVGICVLVVSFVIIGVYFGVVLSSLHH